MPSVVGAGEPVVWDTRKSSPAALKLSVIAVVGTPPPLKSDVKPSLL